MGALEANSVEAHPFTASEQAKTPASHDSRSRGSTRRSKACPLGRADSAVVKTVNEMVGRLLIILMVCQSLRVWWLLEQPSSSVMEYLPLFQQFLRMKGVDVRRLYTRMGWFGGPTQKGTFLYSSVLLATNSLFLSTFQMLCMGALLACLLALKAAISSTSSTTTLANLIAASNRKMWRWRSNMWTTLANSEFMAGNTSSRARPTLRGKGYTHSTFLKAKTSLPLWAFISTWVDVV